MRWQARVEGDNRVKTRFLWFPKCIHGEKRWLERAAWREIYVRETFDDLFGDAYRLQWLPTKWID